MTHHNYLHRKNQLMKTLDRLLARVKSHVSSWLGEEQAKRFMREARQEYETQIPRIPYIGESSLALTFIFPVTRYLAVYRALQRQDRTLEDAGRLIYLIATEEARAIPYVVRRLMEALWFSRWFRRLWVWALAGSSLENQPLGVELASYLVESSFMSEWTHASGLLPTRPQALSEWDGEELKVSFNDVLQSAHPVPSEEVRSVLGPLLQGALIRIFNGEQPEVVARSVIESLE